VDLSAEVGVHYRGKDISMQIRAFWRHIDMESQNKTSRILLTGAAGFLGAFILHKLLTTSHAYLLLLVRPSTGAPSNDMTPLEQCRERVWANLLSYGLAVDSKGKKKKKKTELVLESNQISRDTFDSRVNVLVGDTSLGGLGLDSDDHAYLAQHIDVVVHAAAQVNLLYPYSALAGANVHGTAEIVHFCTIGKVKPLHYISSNSVLPSGSKTDIYEEDQDLSLLSSKLEGGYAQSKWVAEQLVYTAMKGGLPAVVYRCGNLSGDSKTAAWNKKDSNLQFMQACVHAGAAPIFARDNETALSFEMTPVDFVSSFITANIFKIRLASQKTFHVIQPESGRCNVSDFLRLVQGSGYEILAIPLEEWILRQTNEARIFTADDIEELFGMGARVGHRVVAEHLRHLHSLGAMNTDTYAVGDMSRMRSYLRLLTQSGLLPAVPRVDETTPLEGRLVVVSGASSGIGECIARHLVAAGARVSLFARRESRLDALVEELGKSKAVACVVDVTDKKCSAAGVARAEEHFGVPVWGLVNCAGVMHYQRVLDCDCDSWDNQIDVNCKGVLNCVAAVLPSLKAYRRGHVVNITSDAGKKVFAGLAVYSATKFFVEAFAQGLRAELAPLGIKVTNVQPGDVKTELLTHNRDASALAEFGPPEVGAEMLEPEDVAQAVVFALTQKARCAINEVLVEPTGCPL
jgi:thioester reductase-like protein